MKLMKLNRLDTHDRLEHLIEDQSKTIWQGATDCLTKNSDSLKLQEKSPYIYIFAHPRTDDDGFTKRLLWQPRLIKPKAQPNSYLFRAQSKTDLLEICWLIPAEELWSQYKKENLTNEPTIIWSIDQYLYNRKGLEAPDPNDWTEKQARNILISILESSVREKNMNSEKNKVKNLASNTFGK